MDNAHSCPADVRNLADPEIWRQAWFHKMLLAGLDKDGYGSDVVTFLGNILSQKSIKSLANLTTAVKQEKHLSPELENQVQDALTHLMMTADFNRNCYLRDFPESTRVKQWPNNPRTKAQDPRHYFDIHEDMFCHTTARFITPETRIGSAGSCFALRIAHQLQMWGYNYVIEEDDLPPDTPLDMLPSTSFRMAPARVGTLFNTPSMRQMVERAFGEWIPEKLIVQQKGAIRDPFRSIASNYSDIDGYKADYDQHTAALKRALEKCDVMILTLGLTEAWRFAHSNDFTSVSPHLIEPTLLRSTNLNVAQNVVELERLFEVYRRHKPDIKLIISVSPVPLNKTFSQTDHVIVANSLSKAILRLTADEFVRNHPGDAFYLPSYEAVTQGTKRPWETDMRHVSADAVSRVMQLFQHMFLVDQSDMGLAHIPDMAEPKETGMRDFARHVLGPAMPTLRRVRRLARR